MSPRTSYIRHLSDTAYADIDHSTRRGELTRYSVTLVAWHEGAWRTVRVYDNAHGEHDMHRHTIFGEKQPAEVFHLGTASEAFNDAVAAVTAGYEEMIAGWQR